MRPYYEEDGITIYHGDCREILPRLPQVELMLTDPPYGINFASQPTSGQRRALFAPEGWDAEPSTVTVLELLNKAPKVVIWGGNYYPLPASRGWLCWYKPDAPPSMAQIELAWTNQDQNARHITFSIAASNGHRLRHPTQKPLRVIKWSILQVGGRGPILDPFMGTGTTLLAAKQLGLQAIGIEIEERYCEIAVKRLAQAVFDFSKTPTPEVADLLIALRDNGEVGIKG